MQINQNNCNMNNWDRDLYIKAWDFASIHHSGQTFGGPIEGQQIEYLNHIGAVVAELMWMLQNHHEPLNANLLLQCAILHDTIEDTQIEYNDIYVNFGREVANGVMALTKNIQLPNKSDQMNDSINRIKKQTKEVWMVKMADRITNLSEPPYYWNATKIENYYNEALFIFNSLNTCNNILKIRFKSRLDQYLSFGNKRD